MEEQKSIIEIQSTINNQEEKEIFIGYVIDLLSEGLSKLEHVDIKSITHSYPVYRDDFSYKIEIIYTETKPELYLALWSIMDYIGNKFKIKFINPVTGRLRTYFTEKGVAP